MENQENKTSEVINPTQSVDSETKFKKTRDTVGQQHTPIAIYHKKVMENQEIKTSEVINPTQSADSETKFNKIKDVVTLQQQTLKTTQHEGHIRNEDSKTLIDQTQPVNNKTKVSCICTLFNIIQKGSKLTLLLYIMRYN